jgi:hypothetical protein
MVPAPPKVRFFEPVYPVAVLPKASKAVMVRLSATPSAGVFVAALRVRLAAVAALTASCWVADISPPAAAVIVGAPALESPYQRFVLELPAPIFTVVVAAPPCVVEKMVVPVLLDDRVTVMFEAALTGFPPPSCSCTTMGPRVAVLDAAPDTGEVVNDSFVALATGTTVLGALAVDQDRHTAVTTYVYVPVATPVSVQLVAEGSSRELGGDGAVPHA